MKHITIQLIVEPDGLRTVEVWVHEETITYLAAQVRGAEAIEVKFPKGW